MRMASRSIAQTDHGVTVGVDTHGDVWFGSLVGGLVLWGITLLVTFWLSR
jgi:hypothetical protein